MSQGIGKVAVDERGVKSSGAKQVASLSACPIASLSGSSQSADPRLGLDPLDITLKYSKKDNLTIRPFALERSAS